MIHQCPTELSCKYCSLIIFDQLLYKRHHLTHVLLPQLYRNLNAAAVEKEQHERAVTVDPNFSNRTWVRWFIEQEMELLLGNVNHTIEGVDLNAIVVILVKQSLNTYDDHKSAFINNSMSTIDTSSSMYLSIEEP